MFARIVLLASQLGACAHTMPLDPRVRERLVDLADSPLALGQHVYTGLTRTEDGELRYRYSRFVEDRGEGWRITHLTRDLEGEPVVVQIADVDPDGKLRRFEEIHAQTGWSGAAEVEGDVVVYRSIRDGKLYENREAVGSDMEVHAPPSLFGLTVRHWDALREGATRFIRVLSIDRQRSYRFTLRCVEEDEQHTHFELRPTSGLVRAALPPMQLVFDTESRAPARYVGRVPPLDGRGRPFDADVAYPEVLTPFR